MQLRALNYILISLFIVSLFSSCKKQKLEWQSTQQLTTNTTDRLNEILFINDTTGFVVGGQRFLSATILTTHDGGSTWTLHDMPEAGKGLYGITTDKDKNIYICGYDGKILSSLDKGTTWKLSQLYRWESFKKLAYTSKGGIAIGGISFNFGFIATLNNVSVDKKDVSIINFDTTAYELNDIQMLDDNTGYIAGFGVMLKTTDGGQSWTQLDIKNDNFTSLCAIDENHIWTCGYNGSIHFSDNGGTSWQTLKKANSALGKKYRFLDIMFVSKTNGWAVGEEGLVTYTTDGGHTWKEYDRFTAYALRSILSLPSGDLIAAGDNGTLYKLRNK